MELNLRNAFLYLIGFIEYAVIIITNLLLNNTCKRCSYTHLLLFLTVDYLLDLIMKIELCMNHKTSSYPLFRAQVYRKANGTAKNQIEFM